MQPVSALETNERARDDIHAHKHTQPLLWKRDENQKAKRYQTQISHSIYCNNSIGPGIHHHSGLHSFQEDDSGRATATHFVCRLSLASIRRCSAAYHIEFNYIHFPCSTNIRPNLIHTIWERGTYALTTTTLAQNFDSEWLWKIDR